MTRALMDHTRPIDKMKDDTFAFHIIESLRPHYNVQPSNKFPKPNIDLYQGIIFLFR